MLNEQKEVQINEPILDVGPLEIEEKEKPEAQVSHKYLLTITVMCFINSMQFGGVLSASGQCFTTLNQQLNWKEKDYKFNVTLLSFICILGMCIGSSQAGRLFKYSKRRVIMIFQIIAITGSILSFVALNFPLILVGRFFYGISAGVFLSVGPVIIEHSVPGKYMNNGYGSSTNIAIAGGISMYMSLGMLIPLNDAELQTSQVWILIYALPIPFLLISFLLNLFVLTNDTVKHHIEKGEIEIAQQEMKKIYPQMPEDEIKDECNQMQKEFNEQIVDQNQVSIFKSFTDENYRTASWVCAGLSVFMQFAGIDFVLVYAVLIIKKLDKHQLKSSRISPGTLSMIMGMCQFVGPFLSIPLMQKAGRKSILIYGFLFCGIFHLITAILFANEMPFGCLLSMSMYLLIWQLTIGSTFFVYISEVLCGSAIGMAIFIELIAVLFVTFISPTIIDSFSIDTIFYAMAAIQIIPVVLFCIYMKETKGLSLKEKFELYRKDCGNKIEEKQPEAEEEAQLNKSQ